MMRYLLRYCFIALLLQMGCAFSAEEPPSDAPLKLEGIKKAYIFPETVTVKVTNIGPDVVVYGIGIQKQVGEKWQDFMTNIDDSEPIRMAFKLRRIKAHESKSLTWEPKNTPKIFGSVQGTYRVYVIYDVGKDDHRKFYSEAFIIR